MQGTGREAGPGRGWREPSGLGPSGRRGEPLIRSQTTTATGAGAGAGAGTGEEPRTIALGRLPVRQQQRPDPEGQSPQSSQASSSDSSSALSLASTATTPRTSNLSVISNSSNHRRRVARRERTLPSEVIDSGSTEQQIPLIIFTGEGAADENSLGLTNVSREELVRQQRRFQPSLDLGSMNARSEASEASEDSELIGSGSMNARSEDSGLIGLGSTDSGSMNARSMNAGSASSGSDQMHDFNFSDNGTQTTEGLTNSSGESTNSSGRSNFAHLRTRPFNP